VGLQGGRLTNAGSHTSYLSKYSLAGQRWSTLAGCREERQNQGFAALDGKLYCVGGQSKKVLTSVECYQPEIDYWHTLHYAQMTSAVKYPSLVAHDGVKHLHTLHDKPANIQCTDCLR
jgi:hypothetical protein